MEESYEREAREPHTPWACVSVSPQSRSLFSALFLDPFFLFDRSSVLEYAKIWTVLQSTVICKEGVRSLIYGSPERHRKVLFEKLFRRNKKI